MKLFYRLDANGKTIAINRPIDCDIGRMIARATFRDIMVSTVFLGIDHNHTSKGPPILFETMIFHKDMRGLGQRRYRTIRAALNGHREICLMAFPDNADIIYLFDDIAKKVMT